MRSAHIPPHHNPLSSAWNRCGTSRRSSWRAPAQFPRNSSARHRRPLSRRMRRRAVRQLRHHFGPFLTLFTALLSQCTPGPSRGVSTKPYFAYLYIDGLRRPTRYHPTLVVQYALLSVHAYRVLTWCLQSDGVPDSRLQVRWPKRRARRRRWARRQQRKYIARGRPWRCQPSRCSMPSMTTIRSGSPRSPRSYA